MKIKADGLSKYERIEPKNPSIPVPNQVHELKDDPSWTRLIEKIV